MTLKEKVLKWHLKMLNNNLQISIFVVWGIISFVVTIHLFIIGCIINTWFLCLLPLVIFLIYCIVSIINNASEKDILKQREIWRVDFYETFVDQRRLIHHLRKQIQIIKKFKHVDVL